MPTAAETARSFFTSAGFTHAVQLGYLLKHVDQEFDKLAAAAPEALQPALDEMRNHLESLKDRYNDAFEPFTKRRI